MKKKLPNHPITHLEKKDRHSKTYIWNKQTLNKKARIKLLETKKTPIMVQNHKILTKAHMNRNAKQD